MGHFPHGNGGRFSKKAGHFLVTSPVRTFDRIGKMDIRTIAVTHAAISQRGLHTTLGR
jgi:hypothetical protein